MLKLHFGKLSRDFDHAIHITETGGKDQIIALGGVGMQHPGRVRPLRDEFTVSCFHAEFFQR